MNPNKDLILTTITREELKQLFVEAISQINSQKIPERELTQRELAKELRISKPTLIKWQNANLIPYFRVPGTRTIRYYKSQVLAAINQSPLLQNRGHYDHLRNKEVKDIE